MQKTWPKINYQDYKETVSAVHLWTQIIGKIRLRKMPWLNHSWHVSLYTTPRGFSTGSIPYDQGLFEIEFDFIDHQLNFSTSEGSNSFLALGPGSVAEFHKLVMDCMEQVEVGVQIYPVPNEMDPAIPFAEDQRPQTYEPDQMRKLWESFVAVHKVFLKFRAGFIGKCSPVHLFWGAFDLAVTRFSGKKAPEHPGGMPNIPLKVMQEAYSHEVSSAGFWPGNDDFPQPVFYSYCYPTPEEFSTQAVQPEQAFYSQEMGEFFLPYQAVRESSDPEGTLYDFLESTYRAAAITGHWDPELEFDFSEFQ